MKCGTPRSGNGSASSVTKVPPSVTHTEGATVRAKPQGARYRNLREERGSVWYERRIDGTYHHFDLKTTSWAEAAKERDDFEREMGFGSTRARTPTFRELAVAFLQTTARLKRTTQSDYQSYLGTDGPIIPILGEIPIDEITATELVAWWDQAVEARGKKRRTGANYTNAIANVFGLAVERELIDANPVPAFRARVAKRYANARGRAESESVDCNPIERAEDIKALLDAAKVEGDRDYLLVLVMLDAGLRLGEATGLCWGAVGWGSDADDKRRHLLVEKSRSRGGPADTTKSGRSRKVGLSRRLRATLLAYQLKTGDPTGPEDAVVGDLEVGNWRRREWAKILKRAGITGYKPKHLRDTFASQLLSEGFRLEFIQRQLGHASPDTTRKHYAHFIPEEYEYRPEPTLHAGDIPADLLARLGVPDRDETARKART